MHTQLQRKSLSWYLIILSCIVSIVGWFQMTIVQNFGMHGNFLFTGQALNFIVQIFLFQFLHGSIFHLLMNGYFLYSAGPILESRMSQNRFTSFFLINTIWVTGALLLFAPHTITIGMSGFCMAMLAYLWIDLSKIRHPYAHQVLLMLVINIAIGLLPGISLIGHISGAIFGLIWWKLFTTWKR